MPNKLNYQDLEKLSDTEIENIRCEKVKELDTFQDHSALMEQEVLSLQKQIIELQMKKKEAEISLSKSRQVVRQRKNEIDILKSLFWSKKNI